MDKTIGGSDLAYLRLCTIKDIPAGGMKQFDLKDMEFLVINLEGRFLCLDGRCTHAGAPLMEGTLDGTILTCPWHGSRFDVLDGSVVGGPAKKPLNTYRCKVSEGQLFVEIGDHSSSF